MENEFILPYKMACDWWRRSDLEPKPENMDRVAEVLRQAEIEVYSNNFSNFSNDGWLVCEPRPVGIYEALSGELADTALWKIYHQCPPESPGRVLKVLTDKSILVSGT